MTLFRPCIDLHEGRVKQIVGGTLTDTGARENFTSEQSASFYAELYRRDGLLGLRAHADVAGITARSTGKFQRGGLRFGAVPRADCDSGARTSQCLRNREPDAARAAGDEGDFAREVDVHAASKNLATCSALPKRSVRAWRACTRRWRQR